MPPALIIRVKHLAAKLFGRNSTPEWNPVKPKWETLHEYGIVRRPSAMSWFDWQCMLEAVPGTPEYDNPTVGGDGTGRMRCESAPGRIEEKSQDDGFTTVQKKRGGGGRRPIHVNAPGSTFERYTFSRVPDRKRRNSLKKN